ncbi:MAG: 30S ribosomal protein S3 [Elusimicrobiota bacterium]|nr:30S ribosomal protein S3 [Elusimicrobiota bacterium]
MGQKVHPKSLRIGYIYDWDSKWFTKKDFSDFIEQDYKIRTFINKKYRNAGISSVGIERAGKYVRLNINTARPGVIIGKKGNDVEFLKTETEKLTKQKTFINIVEIKNPELDAQLVATTIALQIEKKVSYKKAMKKAMEKVFKLGAKGVKVMIGGRLGGAEIARTEWDRLGRVPLQTFRADVKYGFAEAYTTYGQIGIKVWIFHKEFLERPDFSSNPINIKNENSMKN